MAGERLILLVDRVLKSRTFWRWAGAPLGIVGLAAAGFLVWDADLPGVDPGTRNVQLQAAGWVGFFGLVLLGIAVWAWVGDRPEQPGTGRPVESPDAERGTPSDRGGI